MRCTLLYIVMHYYASPKLLRMLLHIDKSGIVELVYKINCSIANITCYYFNLFGMLKENHNCVRYFVRG